MDAKYWDRYKYLIRSKILKAFQNPILGIYDLFQKQGVSCMVSVHWDYAIFFICKTSLKIHKGEPVILFCSHFICSFCYSKESFCFNYLWPPHFQLVVATQIWYVASTNVTKERDTWYLLFPANGHIIIQYKSCSATYCIVSHVFLI